MTTKNSGNEPTGPKRIERSSRFGWVPIDKMKIHPLAQRDFRGHKAEKIASAFDPDKIGLPVLNQVGDAFYVIDGQHRIAALKLMGWGDQQVQCEIYAGLSEQEMAEMFDGRNDYLPVPQFDKFRVRITAGRLDECEMDRVVRANGFHISNSGGADDIACVGSIRKVYEAGGSVLLGRTIRLIGEAYGGPGMKAPVIQGVGLVCQRYNGEVDDATAIARLSALKGGVHGLMGRARVKQAQLRRPMAHCVASAVVDTVNVGRGGKKLTDWWK